MEKYYPEGMLIETAENRRQLKSIFTVREAMLTGKILEAKAAVCDSEHNLIIELPFGKGIIAREDGAVGIKEGRVRDIAVISRVNKPVCFKVIEIIDEKTVRLSRRAAQEECLSEYIYKLKMGDIIPARVTHLEPFGAFVDVGCGVPSLIPIDAISVSRISHPSDRFRNGQDIRVIIKDISNGRIWLSHKELLGTWSENAEMFSAGETVSGIVRSVEKYGIFVELTPNIAGLAEVKENVFEGQCASVYIKAIIPEKMKIKLIIIDSFDNDYQPEELNYLYDGQHISEWIYSSAESERTIESIFS